MNNEELKMDKAITERIAFNHDDYTKEKKKEVGKLTDYLYFLYSRICFPR